jgi:hypothetical protein
MPNICRRSALPQRPVHSMSAASAARNVSSSSSVACKLSQTPPPHCKGSSAPPPSSAAGGQAGRGESTGESTGPDWEDARAPLSIGSMLPASPGLHDTSSEIPLQSCAAANSGDRIGDAAGDARPSAEPAAVARCASGCLLEASRLLRLRLRGSLAATDATAPPAAAAAPTGAAPMMNVSTSQSASSGHRQLEPVQLGMDCVKFSRIVASCAPQLGQRVGCCAAIAARADARPAVAQRSGAFTAFPGASAGVVAAVRRHTAAAAEAGAIRRRPTKRFESRSSIGSQKGKRVDQLHICCP